MQFFKRTTALFDTQIDHVASRAEAAAALLVDMLERPASAAEDAAKLSVMEREADRFVRETVAIPPHNLGTADRYDLLTLLDRVDDIVDIAHETGQLLWLYQAGQVTPQAQRMARIFADSAARVRKVLTTLRNLGSPKDVLDICIDINRLENECDELYREAMLDLFSGKHEALDVVRWKDVYEQLELGVDRCQEVARLAEGLQQAIA